MLLSIFVSGILIYVIAPLPQVAVLMSFAPPSGREDREGTIPSYGQSQCFCGIAW